MVGEARRLALYVDDVGPVGRDGVAGGVSLGDVHALPNPRAPGGLNTKYNRLIGTDSPDYKILTEVGKTEGSKAFSVRSESPINILHIFLTKKIVKKFRRRF